MEETVGCVGGFDEGAGGGVGRCGRRLELVGEGDAVGNHA